MNENTIRVAIAEDQRLFRECLVSILNGIGQLQVVIEAANGKELLAQLPTLHPLPDVALLDLTMPEMNGLETTQHLKKDYPHIKIIILSVHSEERHIVRMVSMGVSGYLLKNSELSEVTRAVEAVHEKGYYFNDSVLRAMQAGMSQQQQKQYDPQTPLIAREKEVLTSSAASAPRPRSRSSSFSASAPWMATAIIYWKRRAHAIRRGWCFMPFGMGWWLLMCEKGVDEG